MSRGPKYLAIVRRMSEDLLTSGAGIGDPVPSEREIARRYKVSYMTARRAVRELLDAGVLVRDGLQRAAIARLPDPPASAGADVIRRPRVLVLSRDQDSEPGSTASILTGIARQIMANEAWRTRYVFPAPGKPLADAIRDELAGEKADGLLVSCIYSEEAARVIHESGIPAVFIDYAPLDVPMDSVVTDNRSIAFQIMRYLVGLGHRHIDFIGHLAGKTPDNDALEMEMHWRYLLARAEGRGEARYIRGREEAAAAATAIIDAPSRPTALFVSNLTRARELKAAFASQDVSVPDDISIVSVGWGVGGHDSDVSLVAVEWFEVVRTAVQRLQSRMNGKVQAAVRIGCTGRLFETGSSGPPPAC